jgi:hypothetical protein
VRLTTPHGRHPRLGWAAFDADLLRAAQAVDLVGPVRTHVLADLRPLLAHPTIRCIPARGLPLPREQVPRGLDDWTPRGPAPASWSKRLPDDGQFSAVVCGHLALHGLAHPNNVTTEVTAARWVGVTAFDPEHFGSPRLGALRGHMVRDECVWILRPAKLAAPVGEPKPVGVLDLLASFMVLMVYARRPWAKRIVPMRFKLVGLDTLPSPRHPRRRRAGGVGDGGDGEDGEEVGSMDGDEEDGVGGRIWRTLRTLLRQWDDESGAEPGMYERIIANTRLFTLAAYRVYLLADPALGERAIELELGERTLIREM